MPVFELSGNHEAVSSGVLGVRYIRFTVTTLGIVTVRASNTGHDSVIHLFARGNQTNELGNLVASNDDFGGGPDSQLSMFLGVGTYVLAISNSILTETEARQGANSDGDAFDAPFGFEVEIDTTAPGSAVISPPPSHFAYGDADVGNDLAITFKDTSPTIDAVRGGSITITVAGLDSDASATYVPNGAGGADVLLGFGGNDIYYVDQLGDDVYESSGLGSDIVYAFGKHTLTAGSHVEILSAASNASTLAQNRPATRWPTRFGAPTAPPVRGRPSGAR